MDFLNGKKILITGASGMVGTHALERIKSVPDITVRAVYHTNRPQVLSDNILPAQADLTDLDDCREVVRDIDYMLMFAGKIARRSKDLHYLSQNVVMNSQLLEAGYQAGVKKAIWLSSATAYPPSEVPLKEEQMFDGDPAHEYFGYGWMTRYIETLGRMYATRLDRSMSVTVLRPTTIYGEYGDFELLTCHVLSALVRKVAERQTPIEVWGTGQTKRDFVYAGDVVQACFSSLEKLDGFNELNIGGTCCSIKELLELIIETEDFDNAEIVFDTSKSDKKRSISIDCSKAKELIGFNNKTSLCEGLPRTIEWFKKTSCVC